MHNICVSISTATFTNVCLWHQPDYFRTAATPSAIGGFADVTLWWLRAVIPRTLTQCDRFDFYEFTT
jgi:hypothetical protein